MILRIIYILYDVPSIAEGELADGELAEGEPAAGELTEGELAKGELAEGELAEGKLAKGKLAEGEVGRVVSIMDRLRKTGGCWPVASRCWRGEARLGEAMLG